MTDPKNSLRKVSRPLGFESLESKASPSAIALPGGDVLSENVGYHQQAVDDQALAVRFLLFVENSMTNIRQSRAMPTTAEAVAADSLLLHQSPPTDHE